MCEKIEKQLKKNWPDYLIRFVLFVIVGAIVGIIITNSLKPETDISVDCSIDQQTLDVSFYNKADFAGKQLYIYLWDVILTGRSNDYSVSETCEISNAPGVDSIGRTKIFCKMVPPKSNFSFTIHSKIGENVLKTKSLYIEWFGETTPYKKKTIQCNN